MERPEKEKAKVKILGGIKFLKDYLIYQGIRGTTHIPTTGCMLIKDLREPQT